MQKRLLERFCREGEVRAGKGSNESGRQLRWRAECVVPLEMRAQTFWRRDLSIPAGNVWKGFLKGRNRHLAKPRNKKL